MFVCAGADRHGHNTKQKANNDALKAKRQRMADRRKLKRSKEHEAGLAPAPTASIPTASTPTAPAPTIRPPSTVKLEIIVPHHKPPEPARVTANSSVEVGSPSSGDDRENEADSGTDVDGKEESEAEEDAKEEPAAHTCSLCGGRFRTRNALTGHAGNCKRRMLPAKPTGPAAVVTPAAPLQWTLVSARHQKHAATLAPNIPAECGPLLPSDEKIPKAPLSLSMLSELSHAPVPLPVAAAPRSAPQVHPERLAHVSTAAAAAGTSSVAPTGTFSAAEGLTARIRALEADMRMVMGSMSLRIAGLEAALTAMEEQLRTERKQTAKLEQDLKHLLAHSAASMQKSIWGGSVLSPHYFGPIVNPQGSSDHSAGEQSFG